MFHTASNLLYYLLARGLITAEAALDGGFTVVEMGRRNRNFMVLRSNAPGLFVKQCKTRNPAEMATLQRETAFYSLIRSGSATAPIARLAPRLVGYDESTGTLVTELITEAESLFEYHARLGEYPSAVGEQIGRALAVLHTGSSALLLDRQARAVFPQSIPWVLTLDPSTLTPLSLLGGIGAQLASALPRFPLLWRQLLAMRSEWRVDALIHGDVKWDNFLIRESNDGPIDLRIIDWELVDAGDSAWDVAAVMAGYVAACLLLPSGSGDQTPEEMVYQARARLAGMKPAVRAFWRAYLEGRQIPASAEAGFLHHCMRFCAGRLVLAALEFQQGLPQLAPSAFATLQTCQNVLGAPAAAAADLFDL